MVAGVCLGDEDDQTQARGREGRQPIRGATWGGVTGAQRKARPNRGVTWGCRRGAKRIGAKGWRWGGFSPKEGALEGSMGM